MYPNVKPRNLFIIYTNITSKIPMLAPGKHILVIFHVVLMNVLILSDERTNLNVLFGLWIYRKHITRVTVYPINDASDAEAIPMPEDRKT